MVKVFAGTKQEYYMDGYLKTNLDKSKEVIKKDWDMVFLIDGFEGVGKSVFAQQAAKYCDPNFNQDSIAFNKKEFLKKVKTAKQFAAVVYDEAHAGMSAKDWADRLNRMILQTMTEIRYKNLFIFIVLPTFYELTRYIAIWRSRALIHVYDNNFERGFFAFYDKYKKKQLYIKGKKYYSYSKKITNPNFTGRFTNHYTVDQKEYKKRKRENAEKMKDEKEKNRYELRNEIIKNMYKGGITQKKIAKFAKTSQSNISQIINSS